MDWNDVMIFFSLHRRRIYQVIIEFLHPCNKNTKWNNSMKRPPAAAKEIKSWGSVAWGAGNSGRPMGGDTASAGRWKRTGLLPWKARHPGPPCGGRSAAFFRCCGRCPSMIHHAVQDASATGGRPDRKGWSTRQLQAHGRRIRLNFRTELHVRMWRLTN